jgi:4-amino-4-deoxy-L-arabinose transferase-like glycosyltransferase
LTILGFALFLRLYYVLSAEYEPLEWDQLEYTKLAIQWLEKGIYAYRDTVPNTLVTPGWPTYLYIMYGLFGYDPLEPTLMIIRLSLCFLSLVSIWLIYLIGCRLFHPSAGLLAALFAAVHPSYLFSVSLILTEVLFLVFFTAMLYFQVRIIQENRMRDHVWAGLFLGLTVLVRPNALPLAVVPYIFLWMEHRRLFLPHILRGAAAFAVVMLPWWVRNLVTFHEFIFIAKGEAGNPFLGGTDPYFRGTIDWTQMEGKDQFAEGLKRIKQGLREDPWLWIRWFTIGKFKVFFRTIWQGNYPFYIPAWYSALLHKLHDFIVYVGWPSVIGCALARSRSFAFLAISLLIFYAVHALFIPVDRYIYGMLPFLMLAAAQVVAGGIRLFVSAFRVRRKIAVE